MVLRTGKLTDGYLPSPPNLLVLYNARLEIPERFQFQLYHFFNIILSPYLQPQKTVLQRLKIDKMILLHLSLKTKEIIIVSNNLICMYLCLGRI